MTCSLPLLSTNNVMSQTSVKKKSKALMRRSSAKQLISMTAAKEKHPLRHLFTRPVYTLVLNKAASLLCVCVCLCEWWRANVACFGKKLRSVVWPEHIGVRRRVGPKIHITALNMASPSYWWVETSCCEFIVSLWFSVWSHASFSAVGDLFFLAEIGSKESWWFAKSAGSVVCVSPCGTWMLQVWWCWVWRL